MLRDCSPPSTDDRTRAQMAMFHALGEEIQLSEKDRRLALKLDDRAWKAWISFLRDGPLPVEPAPQEMLRRLGSAAFALSVSAEQVRGSLTAETMVV